MRMVVKERGENEKDKEENSHFQKRKCEEFQECFTSVKWF